MRGSCNQRFNSILLCFQCALKEMLFYVGFSSLPDDPNVDWDTKIVSQIILDHIKHNQFQMVR